MRGVGPHPASVYIEREANRQKLKCWGRSGTGSKNTNKCWYMMKPFCR